MAIRVRCEGCAGEFRAPDSASGKKVRCPSCGDPVVVKAASRSAPGSPASSKSSGGVSPLVWAGGGALAMAVLGGVFFLGQTMGRPAAVPEADVAQAAPPVAPSIESAAVVEPAVATTIAEPMANVTATVATPLPENAPTENLVAAASTSSIPMPAAQPIAPSEGTAAPTSPTPTATPAAQPLSLPDLIALVEPSVVRINMKLKTGTSQGSGFIAATDGTVVTNYHVIEEGVSGTVEFVDGTSAKILGVRHTSVKHDIAIIKVEADPAKLKPLALRASHPRKGESTIGFGAPLGLSFTSSQGIVSSIRPASEMLDLLGADLDGTWLQTTTPISPGSSGGPLVDESGQVVGINTLTRTDGQNLNFAISGVDIAAVLAAAPSEVRPMNPEELKPYEKSIGRKAAVDEFDTPRGKALFAGVKKVFLINATKVKTVVLDPTGRIWDRVIARSHLIVERAKIEVSFDEPGEEDAVMLVHLDLKNTRKGISGTQELVISAELICADPAAKGSASPLVRVWKSEESLGTVALEALITGNFPRQADEKLAKFFQSFLSARMKVVREAPAAE